MNYRHSHLNRGDTYDEALGSSPFNAYMARWEARYATDIVRARFPNKVPRYLDFACGTGRITQVIAPLSNETVGVDVSPTMLRVARTKLPDATFIQADLTMESVDLGLFDLITAFRILGNAEQSLRRAVLATLNGLLRAGGLLLINNHRNPHSLASMLDVATGGTRQTDLTHGNLRELLAAEGFEIVETRPIGAWQFRSKIMNSATSGAGRENSLEWIFHGGVWAPIAPDAVVLARPVGRPKAIAGMSTRYTGGPDAGSRRVH
jgi:SAM-dependent methyltransferase